MSAKNGWSIDDVIDYFGECFDQAEENQKKINTYLEKKMSIVESETGHKNYWSRMHRVRELLREDGIDVPFRAVYHRSIKPGRKES